MFDSRYLRIRKSKPLDGSWIYTLSLSIVQTEYFNPTLYQAVEETSFMMRTFFFWGALLTCRFLQLKAATKSWEDKHKELSEQIKVFKKSQKELEDSVVLKDHNVEVWIFFFLSFF